MTTVNELINKSMNSGPHVWSFIGLGKEFFTLQITLITNYSYEANNINHKLFMWGLVLLTQEHVNNQHSLLIVVSCPCVGLIANIIMKSCRQNNNHSSVNPTFPSAFWCLLVVVSLKIENKIKKIITSWILQPFLHVLFIRLLGGCTIIQIFLTADWYVCVRFNKCPQNE